MVTPKGRPKPKGSGRKKHVPPLLKKSFSVTEAQVKLLRMWGRGDASAGLRWLIDQATLVVRRAGPPAAG